MPTKKKSSKVPRVTEGPSGGRRTRDLLIVESPTKARTISRLLGGRMKVLSSRGHIADLPKSRLGVDIEHGFEPEYIRIRGKASVINELKAEARAARTVYLGCDPDREGEAIAFSVASEIRDGAPVKRVLLFEITPRGIKEAFAAPTELDMNKVYSHRARRVLDRLVGYLVSPLLWKIVRGGLSAGRVQTVALRLLVEREREIQAFKPEEYWLVKATFARANSQTFEATLTRIRGAEFKLRTGDEVETVRKGCEAAKFQVTNIRQRERRRRPLPPFVTATMQQDAVQRLNFSAQRAMRTAQELFEGVELAKETVGLITYPRTDSFRVATDFVSDTREFIARHYGAEFLPEVPRHYPDRKGTQGAHEAIRPTRVDRTPDSVRSFLTPDQFRLYDLIYRRFVASQMADAVYSLTEVEVTGGDYTFKADAVRCAACGFERVYGDPEKERTLPPLATGEPLTMKNLDAEQKFTQPPPRFSEATLIKRLETNGIGRPSTYATIVSTLFDRKYAERKEGRLHPTELGMVVNDVLIPRFANVFEVGFTREMEKELDLIEEGSEPWQEVVGRFYRPFKEDLDRVSDGATDIRQDLHQELDEKCPECGTNLVERWGRFGKFVACGRYPDCRYVKKTPPRLLDEKCPECGKPMVERQGRFGPFVACSGYPECRFIVRTRRREPKKLDEVCPECGKPMVERQGRFGPFVACSGYPKCRYIKKEPRKPAAPKT